MGSRRDGDEGQPRIARAAFDRSPGTASGTEDALLPSTQAILYAAGALAVVAGPVLYLFPGETGAYFAWEIEAVLSPVFMGANYLAGMGALWSARRDSWSVARVTMPALIVFSVTQLLATLLHLDVFNWSHPIAWAWLAVYVLSPPVAIAVAIVQERARRSVMGPDTRGAPGHPSFLPFGAIAGLVGLLLIAAPEALAP